MRKLLIALTISAASCAPPSVPSTVSSASLFPVESNAPIPGGNQWDSGSCKLLVTFSGQPLDISDDKSIEHKTNDDHTMQMREGNYVESARCACSPDRT